MTQHHGLVRPLLPGPLDIVGDVHGELGALHALLARLGYDVEGRHPTGRRLVFVGDLCDRGPDSPGVVRLVQRCVEAGRAQCVLGNHEFNLLRGERKHGNHWFFGERHPRHEGEFGPMVLASPAERQAIVQFLQSQPLALERADLRVVHAAWIPAAVEACRAEARPLRNAYRAIEQAVDGSARGCALKAASATQAAPYAEGLFDRAVEPPYLDALAAYDEYYQNENPLRVLTSGPEGRADRPYFAGGKWRFLERLRWWKQYRAPAPVVFGHYWRRWDVGRQVGPPSAEPYEFADAAPDAWLANDRGETVAFCIDYSVGIRFRERRLHAGVVGGGAPARGSFAGRLGALRWPERTLVFDDGDGCEIPTRPAAGDVAGP